MKIFHTLDHSLPLQSGYTFRSQNIFRSQKNDLIRRGIPPDKITPVFNGVIPDDLRPVPPDSEYLEAWRLKNKKVIGFIGSFLKQEMPMILPKKFN